MLVIEHALGWLGVYVESTFVEEPFLVSEAKLVERGPQRLHPGVVFVNDVDPGHGAPHRAKAMPCFPEMPPPDKIFKG